MAARTPEQIAVTHLEPSDAWALGDETVPESRPHDLTIEVLRSVLATWAAASGRSMQVGRNLAIRWDKANPRFGVDPDVYVVEPAPPEGDEALSLLLWKPGHVAPRVAIEVVSSRADKDYVTAPERYAACGVEELWIFDPDRAGRPRRGAFRIQIWCRRRDGAFERVYAGPGPALSGAVQGWLVATDGGSRLRIANDVGGDELWPTAEEAAIARERAAAETANARERAATETAIARERAATEAAIARIAELEAELAKRR